MAGHLDAKEEWMKLNRRIRLAYYIGQPAVDAIHERITGETPAPPESIGIDVDGDGKVDVVYKAD